LGSESVNGEKLNRILVILDKQQFVKLTDFVKQEKGVQNIDENKLSAAIEALKQISIETWINKKTNQINKLTLTIDLDKISDGSLKIVLNLNKIQLNQPSQILQPLDALSLQAAVKRQQESDQQNYDGYQLFKQARYAESKPYFEKALQINPNAYRAENNLGEVLRINKQYDEAIKHFTLGLKINPAHENPGINWMQALKDQNKCEALVSQANDFMKGYPSPKFERYIYWYKADGYYCQSKFAEAKENYLKTLDLNPWPDETFKLYLALASSERWANNLDAALSYGKQAVAWAEQNPRAQITAENLANAHMELVVTYFEKRDFASAKAELKTALSIDKNASKGDFYGSYARIINEH
jgi:tetratricopeptide (TPR) repeat protein